MRERELRHARVAGPVAAVPDLEERSDGSDPYATLIASAQARFGNQAVRSILEEPDGELGALLHEAFALGAAGVHVASDVGALLPNSVVNAFLQRRAAGTDPTSADDDPRLEVIGRGGGVPLPDAVRRRMEAQYGHDSGLSAVSCQLSARGSRSARASMRRAENSDSPASADIAEQYSASDPAPAPALADR